MRVRLAYGETRPRGRASGRPVDRDRPGAPGAGAGRDRRGRARAAPAARGPPLRELVQPGQTVAISICDGTRPQPRHIVIPAILEELDGIVALDDVVILVATGTHRGNTPEELRAMLGDEVVDTVRIVNHDARDDASLVVGRPSRRRRARSGSTASGSRPTSGSRPASSSRTSSPASRAARRWSPRASPASRRC